MGARSLRREFAVLALANLGLLSIVLVLFARLYFGLGLEALITGSARDRLIAIASSFRLDLDSSTDKDAVLRSYASRFEAEAYLINPEGEAIHGPVVDVPPAVMRRMHEGPLPRPPLGSARPPRGKKGPPPGGPPGGPPGEQAFVVRAAGPDEPAWWAVMRLPIVARDGLTRPAMLLLKSRSMFNRQLFLDWRPWVALAGALLATSVLCWLPFLRELTRSVAEMDRVTKDIASGRFQARVPDARADELGELGRQINTMAGQLENFVTSQKRFLGDVAHELSAPLARIQFALGILERRVEEARRGDIEVLRDEIQEMSALVNELLSFSQARLDPGAAPLEPVSVAELARRAAGRESVAPEIRVDQGLTAMARPAQLLRAIGNLLRNAQRYAGEHGPIVVEARRHGGQVAIVVYDHGPGLPDSALEQVFEPFWRPQAARTRDTGGVGLGLAIVKSCVEACGGTVSCRNREPAGLEVTILLSAASADGGAT